MKPAHQAEGGLGTLTRQPVERPDQEHVVTASPGIGESPGQLVAVPALPRRRALEVMLSRDVKATALQTREPGCARGATSIPAQGRLPGPVGEFGARGQGVAVLGYVGVVVVTAGVGDQLEHVLGRRVAAAKAEVLGDPQDAAADQRCRQTASMNMAKLLHAASGSLVALLVQ
jgi:hypothetical protein